MCCCCCRCANSVLRGLPIVRPCHNTIDHISSISQQHIRTFVCRYLPPDETIGQRPACQKRSRHHNRRRRNARPRHHRCPCLQIRVAVRPFRTVPVRCLGMPRSWRPWSERARRHSAPWLCPTGPISSIRRRSWTDRSRHAIASLMRSWGPSTMCARRVG